MVFRQVSFWEPLLYPKVMVVAGGKAWRGRSRIGKLLCEQSRLRNLPYSNGKDGAINRAWNSQRW
jgi:hypothetical protein